MHWEGEVPGSSGNRDEACCRGSLCLAGRGGGIRKHKHRKNGHREFSG